MQVGKSHTRATHREEDSLPEFLCRICHPELNLTPDKRVALEAAERARAAAERAAILRHRAIEKVERAIVSATKRGDPDPTSVGGKILASNRKKLIRLQAEDAAA